MNARVFGFLFWFGLVFAAFGCSREQAPSAGATAGSAPAAGGSAAAAPAKVKLALNWVPEPEFGGFYAAREIGAYKRNGLDVEILGGGAGVPVLQMVATGKAEFGISNADEIITAVSRGADIVALFTIYQTFPQGIMAHPSRGAKSMADVLSSGTLAIEPGVPYAAFLKKKFGFDKVKIVPYDGGVARFIAEKDFAQQCFVTAEPVAARRKGVEPTVFLVADEGFNPYAGVVIASKALWKKDPEQVRAFVRASREGWRAYLDDPAPANAVMAKLNTSMDAETFKTAAELQEKFVETEETKKKPNGLGQMTRERWETMGKQLVELGVLERAPAVDDYLVTIE
ncbi:ABC transporter substrate-binding protein [Sorangium sp. So ce131]|uniref:ABC transporter substrate-binding protein n=1 Tax=Sorangium sp. So ce131 TaxID=3133282 RepID=UPI003F610C68